MKNLLVIFGLIMLGMISLVSAQELGGEQVYSYRTDSEKANFDEAVRECTNRHFGYPKGYYMNGNQGMDLFTWKAVDFVVLEKENRDAYRLIPVIEKNGKYLRKERFSMKLEQRNVDCFFEGIRNGKYDVNIIRGEYNVEMRFSNPSANVTSPDIGNTYTMRTKRLYLNGPDKHMPFIRQGAMHYNGDMHTVPFDKQYEWKVLPGKTGVAMAKELKVRMLREDELLQAYTIDAINKMSADYNDLAKYYSLNGNPTLDECKEFERLLLDDHKFSATDAMNVPEGFYAVIPSKRGFRDEVTWKKYHGIMLVVVSHEQNEPAGCEDCEEEEMPVAQYDEPPRQTIVVKEEPVTPPSRADECEEGDNITSTIISNYYYGTMPDSTAVEEEDTIVVEPKPVLRGFLMGTYGKTLNDGTQQDVLGVHVGYYPFSDERTFWRRVGFGAGYENGRYFSSRETTHTDLGEGYYGKSFTERDNAHFDGGYVSLHFIPVTNNVQRDWLSLYGTFGYRWYKADEFSTGRTFNAEGLVVEEESNLITPLAKEMYTFGFGVHLKPWRWFIIGVDATLGKSTIGWEYDADDVPAMISGADKNFMLKSVMLKAGFCF